MKEPIGYILFQSFCVRSRTPGNDWEEWWAASKPYRFYFRESSAKEAMAHLSASKSKHIYEIKPVYL